MCDDAELATQVQTGQFENNSKSKSPCSTVPCIKVSENTLELSCKLTQFTEYSVLLRCSILILNVDSSYITFI